VGLFSFGYGDDTKVDDDDGDEHFGFDEPLCLICSRPSAECSCAEDRAREESIDGRCTTCGADADECDCLGDAVGW